MITTNLTGNLGNHMWYYSICRIVAEKLGYEWGIDPTPEYDYHGGANQMYFMNVDFGKPITTIGRNERRLKTYDGITHEYYDKHKEHSYNGDNCLINMYDDNVWNIKDNTMIHLITQSEDYLIDRKEDVINWFQIKEEYKQLYENKLKELGILLDDNTCVINFRGGEFKSVYNLIPNTEYWSNSIKKMKEINPNMRFIIISDDTQCANTYMPGIPCYHIDIGFDFFVVNTSKYLILSNSTFSWWASWLNTQVKFIIAPKYWGRYNSSNGYWSLGDSYTRGFNYMGRDGVLYDYEYCKNEALEFYKNNNLI